MRSRWMCLHLVGAVLSCVSMPTAEAASAEPATVTLAREGQATLPVVLVDPGDALIEVPWTQPSLDDLTHHLAQITGGTFESRTIGSVPAEREPAIYVGLARDFEALGVTEPLEPQQCLIRTTADGSLLLLGGDARGVSHAIYTFLDELGCRWYYPGDLWAIIPDKPTLTVTLDLTDAPDFALQRRIWVGGGLGSDQVRKDFPDWQRRNRAAKPFDVWTAHTWFGLDRPDGSN